MLKRSNKAARRRAQTLNNFRAWCERFSAPHFTLLDERYRPLRGDRLLIRATEEWLGWLTYQAQHVDGVLYTWDVAIKDHYPLRAVGIDEDTAIEGWRGRRVFAAIQIIHHLYHELRFLEVDFDLGNPATGLLGAVVHAGEWLYYRLPKIIGRRQIRTDPFLVAKWLRRSGIPVEIVGRDYDGEAS